MGTFSWFLNCFGVGFVRLLSPKIIFLIIKIFSGPNQVIEYKLLDLLSGGMGVCHWLVGWLLSFCVLSLCGGVTRLRDPPPLLVGASRFDLLPLLVSPGWSSISEKI